MRKPGLKSFLYLTVFSCITIMHGCSFTTQTRSKSPHFNGVLNFSNEPIKNARIMLSLKGNDSLCLKASQFTTTNELGQFSLKSAKEEYTYTPFVNYSLDEWVVCAKYNDQLYTLYSNNRYDSGNVTGSIYLDCDLALNPLNQPCNVTH